MLLGIDYQTTSPRRLTPDQALELAGDRGLDGVQFRTPSEIDPSLDERRLETFRARAENLGLFLEVGVPSPNPIHRSGLDGRPVAPGAHARGLIRSLEAVAALGCRHSHAYVGDRHDRFRTDLGWETQQAATLEVLRLLRPTLKSLGLRIALENHADLTAGELRRLVTAAGPDVTGVALDTGNLLMRLDDPILATAQLAPHVLCVHVKDAVLSFTERGLRWQVRPAGSGVLPLTEMLACVARANPNANIIIALHPQTHDLPIFDRSWLARFSELEPTALAAVVQLAAECERRFQDGTLVHPDAIDAIPWDHRDLEWLARSAGYLRPILQLLGSL